MTKKQDPVELDSILLITHAAQSNWSFEGYTSRVVRAARIKMKKIGEGLQDFE